MTRHPYRRILAAASVTLVVGCSDTSAGDGVMSPIGEGEARFAVIRSDYETTSIAVLDASAEVLTPALLSSGSQAPGLVAPLSGDVVLSSGAHGAPGVLHIIDRLGTDVITRLDLRDGAVLGQLRVAPGDFSTNPQDLLLVDEARAWVSRLGVNLDANAAPFDRANDVIEIDPSSMMATGRRVGLSSFDIPVPVVRDNGTTIATAYARPGGLALVGGTLAVGLSLLTFEFDGAGPGRLALVDVGSGSLSSFELPEAARNCGSVQEIPGALDSVLVACSGFARPVGDPAQVRASAGIYRVRLDGSVATLVWSWEPRSAPAPLAVQNVVALGPHRFLAVAHGRFGEGGDEAFVVDARTGEATSVVVAGSAFSLGVSAFDPDTGHLVIPDASVGRAGLRVLTLGANGVIAASEVRIFTDGPLPPRLVRRLP